MSKDGQEIAPSSPWEITRFEFVYFNRRHKRWQIWQEPPQASPELAASEAANSRPLYRRQFQQLLRIVRDCFQALLPGLDEKSRFVMPSSVGESLQFKVGYDKVLGKDLTFWKGFLSYCSKSLEWYGAGSPDLDQLLNDPHLAALSENPQSHRITRREALDLISILPILRDWDLFGCWHRAWIDDQRLAPENWGFPPRQAAAGQWIEPFYIARLRYTDRPSSPESPLDNEIPTQVICTNLGAGDNGIRLVFPERDFFDPIYCSIPRNDNLLLYRSYAYFYDRLQQALTSTTSAFIISYPVVCLSRTHFLQIQITRSGQPQASVEDLWRDWMTTVHPLFWSPHVKQFLSEELQRIGLSTFQAMWSNSLQERVAGGDAELRLDDMIETFCDQAYSLVPLRAIRHGRKKWAYERYNKEDTRVEAWSAGERRQVPVSLDKGYGDLGAQWMKSVSDVENGSSDEKDGVTVTWDDPGKPGISLFLSSRYSTELERTLQEGRARQIAEQQIEFGYQLRASMKEEVRRAQAVQQEAQAAIYSHFSNPRNRLAYRPGYTGEVSVLEAVFRAPKMAFEEVVEFAWPDQDRRQKEITRLVGVTVPLEASEILEIGAVKALTHEDDGSYWRGGLETTIPYLEALKARCLESPDDDANPAVAEWKRTLPLFIQECIASASQGKSLNDRNTYDYLRQENDEATWTRLFPTWKHEETPTVYSFRPCFPIWEGLDLSKTLKTIDLYSAEPAAFVAFALPLAARPVSTSEPWGHTVPQLFRNVFRCRYRPKIKGPHVWQRFVDTEVWATVRGSSSGIRLARYGSLYLGRRDGDNVALFDCTFPGDPVPARLEDIFPSEDAAWLDVMKQTFECTHEQVIAALVFDTWRTT